MVATSREGYDFGLIVGTLETIRKSGIRDVAAFMDLKTLIASAVKLDEQLPRSVRRDIINEAVHAAIRKKSITARALLDEIDNSVINYRKRPETKYDVVTSISVSRHRRLKKATIAGCPIHFSGVERKEFRESRQTLLEDAKHSVCGELPKDYTVVKVRVAARSELEALDRGIDALDLLRAFWNLAVNRGSRWRMSSGKRKPVNQFVLGPIHTLHKTTGELATNNWWYQPDYQGPVAAHDPSDSMTEKMFRYADYGRLCLRRSGYAEHLVTCLLRYVRALDTSYWEDSYLRLWGVLEQLTSTSLSGNYKLTIQRASVMWKDRKYARQVLTHLRDYRNVAVHVGSENHDIEIYMYQLKRFVEALIDFHLRNRFRFKSIDDVAEFMDQPDDGDELRRKMRILKAAQVFHSQTS